MSLLSEWAGSLFLAGNMQTARSFLFCRGRDGKKVERFLLPFLCVLCAKLSALCVVHLLQNAIVAAIGCVVFITRLRPGATSWFLLTPGIEQAALLAAALLLLAHAVVAR